MHLEVKGQRRALYYKISNDIQELEPNQSLWSPHVQPLYNIGGQDCVRRRILPYFNATVRALDVQLA